jgi:glycine/serine hydroxymethyltransferase
MTQPLCIKQLKTLEKRNSDFLHLTINENQLSETARQFLGSKLAGRYYFGGGKKGIVDFTSFTFVGLEAIQNVVDQAESAVKKMTGGAVVNLNCLSGVHAMMCAILSTTNPGDVVMTVRQEDGGHFATKGILDRVGRRHVYAKFDINKLSFDVKKTAEIYRKSNAKAFYMDVSNHLNPHNLRDLRKALGKKAIIIYDASHTLGLILGGIFQNPFAEGADVICANTHKTLPGPHKGLIIFKNKDFGTKANSKIIGTLYSSVQPNHLIALAITLLEWEQFGKAYALQVIRNSQALGQAFADLGYEVRHANTGRFTENEQLHVFTDTVGDRLVLYKRLVDNYISTNFQNVLGGRNFMRIGTQEITRRGMKENDMRTIAQLVDDAFKGKNVKKKVISFSNKFLKINYSFDK